MISESALYKNAGAGLYIATYDKQKIIPSLKNLPRFKVRNAQKWLSTYTDFTGYSYKLPAVFVLNEDIK